MHLYGIPRSPLASLMHFLTSRIPGIMMHHVEAPPEIV